MKCLVTGAAGFIGAHLCRALLERGDEVVGLDCFTDYYPRAIKERAVADLRDWADWRLVEADLNQVDLPPLLGGVEVVFHLAAQPGVRASWGQRFETYVDNNIRATQRLLEAVKEFASGVRLVFAGSSSVYGNAPEFPTSEDVCPRPVSPYGVTKLAGEHLMGLYHANFALKTVSLRYFTVFGPGQRPDMAFHRFIKAALTGDTIRIFGDGRQSRDFTYVGDIVQATLAAAKAPEEGTVGQAFNVGGGNRMTVNDVLAVLAEVIGRRPRLEYQGVVKGDVRDTEADISRARSRLGYSPGTGMVDGLRAEAAWIEDVILK
ncbi:MAG: NAD-dependent epimerase/dehydratase family protein [Proteobacteria bacterium]|nr:NAD-dependent epimerase/dehydratase family protein [Pseudomonadota bacterium]MBU1739991.1 NAD-dependent epimerase/dehydratase family protein [Pseudomonadota bacterium]